MWTWHVQVEGAYDSGKHSLPTLPGTYGHMDYLPWLPSFCFFGLPHSLDFILDLLLYLWGWSRGSGNTRNYPLSTMLVAGQHSLMPHSPHPWSSTGPSINVHPSSLVDDLVPTRL